MYFIYKFYFTSFETYGNCAYLDQTSRDVNEINPIKFKDKNVQMRLWIQTLFDKNFKKENNKTRLCL